MFFGHLNDTPRILMHDFFFLCGSQRRNCCGDFPKRGQRVSRGSHVTV
jgi:hypothetical protein